jgi:hypothetical protein
MASRPNSSRRSLIVSWSQTGITQPRGCPVPPSTNSPRTRPSTRKVLSRLTFDFSVGIQRHAKNGDATRFYRLKAMIDDPKSIENSPSPYPGMAGSSPAASIPATPYLGPSKTNHQSAAATYNMGGGPAATYRITGHPSKLLLRRYASRSD